MIVEKTNQWLRINHNQWLRINHQNCKEARSHLERAKSLTKRRKKRRETNLLSRWRQGKRVAPRIVLPLSPRWEFATRRRARLSSRLRTLLVRSDAPIKMHVSKTRVRQDLWRCCQRSLRRTKMRNFPTRVSLTRDSLRIKATWAQRSKKTGSSLVSMT